jgi:hypothetical protein
MRYNHGKGCESYVYFEAEEKNAVEVACKKAIDDLAKAREGQYPRGTYAAPKTAYVVEYSRLWNRAVRGGKKFKIGYCYAKFMNSKKEVVSLEEWYDIKK